MSVSVVFMPSCGGVQHLNEGNVKKVNLRLYLGKVDRKHYKHSHPVAQFKIKSFPMLRKLLQLCMNVYGTFRHLIRTGCKTS